VPLFGSSGPPGTILNYQVDAVICGHLSRDKFEDRQNMLIIAALLSAAACGAHDDERLIIASTFRPWALNDSKAFVFPRVAEKRNRGRRERLLVVSVI